MGLFDFLKQKEHKQVSESTETVTDIDGNVYTTIKIGKQIWTVENLKTTKYNDGTQVNSSPKAAYCWYNNDIANKEKYGALYNWYAVATGKLAPKGWHVPSDNEWTELKEYLIANGYNWDGTKEGNKIAKSLVAKTDWEIDTWSVYGPYSGRIGEDRSGNFSGFSALPGGYCLSGCAFKDKGKKGFWWCATEDEDDSTNAIPCAYCWNLSYDSSGLYRESGSKKSCCSVRLVRDN